MANPPAMSGNTSRTGAQKAALLGTAANSGNAGSAPALTPNIETEVVPPMAKPGPTSYPTAQIRALGRYATPSSRRNTLPSRPGPSWANICLAVPK